MNDESDKSTSKQWPLWEWFWLENSFWYDVELLMNRRFFTFSFVFFFHRRWKVNAQNEIHWKKFVELRFLQVVLDLRQSLLIPKLRSKMWIYAKKFRMFVQKKPFLFQRSNFVFVFSLSQRIIMKMVISIETNANKSIDFDK